jgi:hypothetical protein
VPEKRENEVTSRPVSRVWYGIRKTECATAIHLGRLLPGASSNLPGQLAWKPAWACARAVPIRSCSRWGLPCRLRCRKRGGLLPHPFTLTAAMPRRFALCGTFPKVALAGCYPAPCLHGARTFLRHGLSALVAAAVWPTGTAALGGNGDQVKQAHSNASITKRPRSFETIPGSTNNKQNLEQFIFSNI